MPESKKPIDFATDAINTLFGSALTGIGVTDELKAEMAQMIEMDFILAMDFCIDCGKKVSKGTDVNDWLG